MRQLYLKALRLNPALEAPHHLKCPTSYATHNSTQTVRVDDEINTNGLNLNDMRKEIWQMHPQIANHRHEEAHKTITYQESCICLKVIELCNEKNIAVLPIHDSFVVKKHHRDALEENWFC
jgi:hypothetical protein